MNYLSPVANDIAWHGAVETLFGIEITPRCKVLRTILAELARIQDHLLCVGAAALDLGAITGFLYSFNPREKIYDIMTADADLVARFEFEGAGTPGASVLVSSADLAAALDTDTNGLLTLVVTRETFDADPDGYVHNFASREHETLEPPALVFNTCLADLDGDGVLTIFDFLEFQNLFDAGDPIADFDGDGSLTLFDFLAFQNAFDAGCP